MKRKILLTGCLILLLMFSFSSMTMAANATKISLNINGLQIKEQEAKIINQTTFVPIRAISLLPNLEVHWDNKTKTVSVIQTVTKEVLQLTIGKNLAYKGGAKLTLDTPARIINGSTYVPLRFLGEALNMNVVWDAGRKTVVIYSKDNKLEETVKSNDLAQARKAVLKLPRITLQEQIVPSAEGWVVSYYFPYGEIKRFFIENKGIMQYYEVKNNAAWVIWEGRIDSTKTNGQEVIPNLVPSVSEEWGQRPSYSGKLSYFHDSWMQERLSYGVIDENGVSSRHSDMPALTVISKKICI